MNTETSNPIPSDLAEIGYTNGECYDEDSGDHIGEIDLKDINGVETLPAQLSVFFNGYWYIFHAVSRYKEGEQNEKTT